MDPDIVRQQEEAQRAAAGLPPKKPVNGSADPVQSRHAFPDQAILDFDTPETPVALPYAKPAAATTQAINPNRRALPPIGSGRAPGEALPPRRRVRGMLRLFLYALGGAMVGGILGFAGVTYLQPVRGSDRVLHFQHGRGVRAPFRPDAPPALRSLIGS